MLCNKAQNVKTNTYVLKAYLPPFYQFYSTSFFVKKVSFYSLFSAGVGRTGTYIALDALYHMGKQTGTVNVVEFVKKMRGNRVSMVQTFVSLL